MRRQLTSVSVASRKREPLTIVPDKVFLGGWLRLARRLRSQRAALVALFASSFLLLIAWSFAVPIFESPDEPDHWNYAQFLRTHHVIPVYGPAFDEANEPPLYYALIAPLAVGSERPPADLYADAAGNLRTQYPPRIFTNRQDDFTRYWPIRIARIATAIMSLLTVVFTYFAGREATGKRTTGILAAGLLGFLPEFTFRGMNVSTDALSTMLCAVAVYLALRILKRGYTPRIAAVLAVAVGAALLSKASTLCVIPACALVLFLSTRSWKARVSRTSWLLLSFLLVFPWLVRNQIEYGDPLASGAMLHAVSGLVDKKSLDSSYFVTVFPNWLSRSFVAVFGWMNIWVSEWIYRLFAAIGMIALAGIIARLLRFASERVMILVLLTIPLFNLIVVLDINLTFDQPQGRYMFPALSAIAVLIALGLERLPGWVKRPSLFNAAGLTGLAALNVGILTTVIIPSYWPAPAFGAGQSAVPLTELWVHNLTGAPWNGNYRVTGIDPQINLSANFDASRFRFLTFRIRGSASGAAIPGAVYFALNGQLGSELQKIPFTWTPYGQRTVVVTLDANPLWHGYVTALRIDPINLSVVRYLGMKLSVDQVRIENSIPRP